MDKTEINYTDVFKIFNDNLFLKIKHRKDNYSLFSIVGSTYRERWHSAFLSWILNPKSSHGLGDYPLRCLLNYVSSKVHNNIATKDSVFKKNVLKKIPLLSDLIKSTFIDTKIQPDISDGNNNKEYSEIFDFNGEKHKVSFDIYSEIEIAIAKNENNRLSTKNILMIIENKIKAKEGKREEYNQTDIYEAYLSKKKFDFIISLFLTPNAKDTPKNPYFVKITYHELVDYVLSYCIEHPLITEKGKILTDEYLQNLTDNDYALQPRDIIDSKDFYAKHRQKLELIKSIIDANAETYMNQAISEPNSQKRISLSDLGNNGIFDNINMKIYIKVDNNYLPKADIINENQTFFIKYEGERYYTPSSAGLAMNIFNSETINGWDHLYYKEGIDSYKPISTLRDTYKDIVQMQPTKSRIIYDKNYIDYLICIYKINKDYLKVIQDSINHTSESGNDIIEIIPTNIMTMLKEKKNYYKPFNEIGVISMRIKFKTEESNVYAIWNIKDQCFIYNNLTFENGNQLCKKVEEELRRKSQTYQWSSYWTIVEIIDPPDFNSKWASWINKTILQVKTELEKK